MKQVQALTIAAENGLKGRAGALRAEGGALQQQLAILSPSVKAAKIKAFETKQAALQGDAQKQQGLIQAEWGSSENNRQAKFYQLTRDGRKQLAEETRNWERLSAAVGRVLTGL